MTLEVDWIVAVESLEKSRTYFDSDTDVFGIEKQLKFVISYSCSSC